MLLVPNNLIKIYLLQNQGMTTVSYLEESPRDHMKNRDAFRFKLMTSSWEMMLFDSFRSSNNFT